MIVTPDTFAYVAYRLTARPRHLALDFETNAKPMYLDGVARGFAVSDGDDAWYFPATHPGSVNLGHAQLRGLLRDMALGTLIFHNSSFDRSVLAQTYGVEVPDDRFYDTLIGDWLLNENENHQLKEIGARLFGQDAKAEQKALSVLKRGRPVAEVYREMREELRLAGVKEPAAVTHERAKAASAATKKTWATYTAEDIAAYACQDAVLTYALWEYQVREMDVQDPSVLPAVEREHAVASLAYRLQRTGVQVDQARAAASLEDAERRLLELAVGIPGVNLRAAAQLAALLYDTWGLPCSRYTPVKERVLKDGTVKQTGGARSTDKIALDGLSWDPRVQQIQEFKELAKQIDAFFLPLAGQVSEDGRVHPSFNSHRTRTGRWSASWPNVQQTPKEGEVRASYIAAPGYVLVSSDLPNAELRFCAELAQETLWLEAFDAGRDLHSEMAEAMTMGRHEGKTCNFMLLYGTGPRKLSVALAQGTGQAPSLARGRKVYDAYWAAIPHARMAFLALEDHWKKTGVLPIPGAEGRFRRMHFSRGVERSYKALNSVVQGGVAELVKSWMLAAEPPLADLGARMVMQVHDSIVAEALPGTEAAVGRVLQQTLDAVNFLKIPFPLDTKAGPHLDALVSV